MIYFVRALGTDNYKIGFAENVSERVKALQTASPHKLRVVASCEGDLSAEKALHRQFHDYRTQGEWFQLAPDEVAAVVGAMGLDKEAANGLIGRYFHSWNAKREIEWQGRVLSEVSAELFLVQLYEWLAGEPSVQKLVAVRDMLAWTFYSSAADMIAKYEDYAYRAVQAEGIEPMIKPMSMGELVALTTHDGNGLYENKN